MDNLDISIVTYNSSRWIEPFIDSLLKQDYPTQKINLYFTDNSSTDSTYSELMNVKKKYGEKFNLFEVYNCRNNGFGVGHNNNIFRSKSKFILVTNIDLIYEKKSLVTVVQTALQDDEVVASWEFRQKPFEHPKYYNGVNLETTWSSSACILFRRSALDKIGGYEKRIFMYGEDVEISYRLRDYGYKLKYCPKAVCWHYTYEHENQVKPLQFLGSTLANIYLRIRYGDLYDIVKGIGMYFILFTYPENFRGQRLGILKNLFKLLFNMPYFLFSRKKSTIKFGFIGWDYEKQRDGAFYNYEDSPASGEKVVSVIIRTYGNRMGFLKEATQSVINQTYPKIEIVVVEDGTNYAEKFINIINKPNIISVKYKSIAKAGRCVAGNSGLAIATGDYFVFLDDDDVFFADHLEVVMGCIEKDGVMAAYANGCECKTKVISQEPLVYEEIIYNVFYRQKFSRILMWHNNYIPIQTIVFSRNLYDELGGFDLELDNLEDWHLWMRYSFKNDFKYINKTTSLYRVPADNNVSIERQKILDGYYEKVLEKQNDLIIHSISVNEIMKMYKDLNQQLLVFTVSKDSVKNIITKYNALQKLYYFARKLYYKLRC